jgi:S1 RNA binding domain protein
MTIEPGSIVRGTVVKIADFGAIVRLGGGKSGLIHISEIADTFVRNVRDYVREEDEVVVKVLRVNNKGRYELSLKQCEVELPAKPPDRQLARAGRSATASGRPDTAPPPAPRPPPTFEDRLSRFMKDSEQRQHDLRRHLEAKRGRK